MLGSLIIGGAINAAVFVGLALAPDPAVAAAMLAAQGFAVAMWNVVTVSLRQRIVPAPLLGRVNSVYRMLGWGLMPADALAGGFVAHAAGPRAPYITAGIICGLSLLAALPFLHAAGTRAGSGCRRIRIRARIDDHHGTRPRWSRVCPRRLRQRGLGFGRT